jgi:hypothetical protein
VNIALPALVVLVGLLPGITAYYTYFGGRFEKRRALVSALEEAALYVVFAIPIDVVAFLIFRWAAVDLDMRTVFYLLAGNIPEPELIRIASLVEANAGLTAVIYLIILGVSAASGMLAREAVWRLRLDTRLAVLKNRHPWFYMFYGRDKNLVPGVLAFVDVLAEHAEDRTRLYRGLVADYDMAPDGKLESLTLKGARRGKGRGKDFKFIPIPSSLLVIMGCKIHSINVTYFNIDDDPAEAELQEAEDVQELQGAGDANDAIPESPQAPSSHADKAGGVSN